LVSAKEFVTTHPPNLCTSIMDAAKAKGEYRYSITKPIVAQL